MNIPILLEDLGMKYPHKNAKRKLRYGRYECPVCKRQDWIVLTYAINRISQCIKCARKKNKLHGLKHGQAKNKHKDYNGSCFGKNYQRWTSMKSRCYNKNATGYKNYGGRGIEIFKDWINSFEKYNQYVSNLDNANLKNHTIDRIENDLGYCPNNLRWVNRSIQNMNIRNKYNKTGFLGVSKSGKTKFNSTIRVNKKRIYLGSFFTALEAAIARNNYIDKYNLPNKKSQTKEYNET